MSNKLYSIEQCMQMIERFTSELQQAIADVDSGSWYDGRTVAREALHAWRNHLNDAQTKKGIK